MNSLNVKHQGKSSNQLAFHLSAYTIESESDSYDKNDMQKKLNVLVRLHEVMQEKWKAESYSQPIQILILVPDKWSRTYCSEYFNILEYLV